MAAPISSPQPTTTPTLMPAFAPTLSSASSLRPTSDTPLTVGVVTRSAQCAVPLTRVQLCVTAQQPPPRLEAQLIWLVVQPVGTCETRGREEEDDGVMVETHWLPDLHTEPYEQQPPPMVEGQPNTDVPVQTRLQHAAATDVVTTPPPAVAVTILLHWNCCWEHGDPHVEPMRQHAARLVAVGLMMQLFRVPSVPPSTTARAKWRLSNTRRNG